MLGDRKRGLYRHWQLELCDHGPGVWYPGRARGGTVTLSDLALIALKTLGWALLPALLLGRRFPRRGVAGTLAVVVWCALGVVLAGPGLWAAMVAGYSGDLLYTLAPRQQIADAGLALVLSLGLCVLVDWLAKAVVRRAASLGLGARAGRALATLAGALVLYAVGTILSPQLFYSYYRTIIPDLPGQWVIDPAASLERLGEAAQLASGGSLAEHGAGALPWALVGIVSCHFILGWRGYERQA